MADPEFDELVIALLTAIAKNRLQFVIPIVRHQPSGWIIDGNHRLEVIRRLKETDPGLVIGHRFQDDYSPDPEALAIELNKARRPWNDAEERRTQVQILARTPVPGGRSGQGGGANGKPPAGTIAPPSTRQIAAVLGVDEGTVRNDLQATAEFSAVAKTPSHLDPEKLARLEQLYQEHVKPDGTMPRGKGRDWLASQTGLTQKNVRTWLEKQTKSTTTTPPINGTRATEATEPADILNLDLDATRQRINAEVQRSDRPTDFKRAIDLLTELDTICTAAWYRKHPEPWGHDDWAHVASEIALLHSIVGQRAEETADELVGKMSAIRVEATTIA
jgi:hypothetical protein